MSEILPASGYAAAVEARFPGLVAAARNVIEESERAFAGARKGGVADLWEHSSHVAALEWRLALAEKADPILAAVVGLFHDAGKFAGGSYHRDDRAEEESAAEIAAPLLAAAGMRSGDARKVTGALRRSTRPGRANRHGPNAIASLRSQ